MYSRILVSLAIIAALFKRDGVSAAAINKKYLFFGVGVRDGHWERDWLQRHAEAGFPFRPVLFEPDRSMAPRLQNLLEQLGLGGRVISAAAWTGNDGPRRLQHGGTSSGTILRQHGFNASEAEREATAADSDSIWVDTIDFKEVLREELGRMDPDPHLMMRMDCEGCEYELLRDLIVQGLACHFQQIYVETHAMYMKDLHHLRPVDVVLPWLLGAPGCGVEVFVDNHYFIEKIWRDPGRQWPAEDEACFSCPSLYRPIPPNGPAGGKATLETDRCPASIMPSCFDEDYPCERCCSLRHGLKGDPSCWQRPGPAWHTWRRLGLLSYDFCCSLMLPMSLLQRSQSMAIDSVGLEAASAWRDTSFWLRDIEP